jgi:hypothetical protein
MKERVAGARGQSADRNYRRPYESGQLTPMIWMSGERIRLFRKTEVGGRHFRFLVVFGRGISEFPRENVISCLA